MSKSPSEETYYADPTASFAKRSSLGAGVTQPDSSSLFTSSISESISRPVPAAVGRSHRNWPLAAIVVAVIGTGIAGKFYRDAELLKSAAAQEKRSADQAMENAEREVAAAIDQVRRAFDQAARADVHARELARSNDRELGRLKTEMEAAVAQARREAEEQTRKALAPQLELARAAASPGILKVASTPAGAEVYVDGRLAGRTPATIEGLPPGRQAITIGLAGHIPQEVTADVIGGKTIDLGAVQLPRATGAVAVSSSPAQLEFRIRPAGTPDTAEPLRSGRTPAQFDDLPTGDYLVQFRRAGWPDRTERVTVERDATAKVAPAFEAGSVVITSTPAGATVLQDGLLLGKTPLTVNDVPPREVSFELGVPGYEPLRVGGTLVGGRKLELNGTLLKLDRVATAAEVRTPPRLYYAAPIDLGRSGRSAPRDITVSFVVPPDGSPREIKVLDPVDKKIEKRSIEGIAKWKFLPAVSHAGFPVKVRMSMPVRIASRG